MGILTKYYIFDNTTGAIVQSGKEYDTPALRARTLAGQTFVVADDNDPSPPRAGVHRIDPATGAVSLIPPSNAPKKSAKIQALRDACAAAITAGFRSTALNPGADQTQAYFYPSDMTSQMDLLHGSPVMCRDASNVWALRDHTDAQLATVRSTFASLLASCRTRLATLEAQAQVATTQADLDAITWAAPPASKPAT